MPLRAPVLALVLVALAAGVASAQEAAPEPRRAASVTISPIHLILPVVELTGEFRASDKVGVAVIVGAGSVKIVDSDDRVSLWEVGASVRYYVLGDFDGGMQIGGEATYIHGDAASGGVSATADGVSIGAFIGYKWIHGSGFTFDGQLGGQYIGVGAESSEGDSDEEQKAAVLLNLNIGWSF